MKLQKLRKVGIITVNGTSFAAALNLACQSGEASGDLFLCQELIRSPLQKSQCILEANRAGFHCQLHPSIETEQGGWSGGVMVLSRWQYSLTEFMSSFLQGAPTKFSHRFILGNWYGLSRDGNPLGSVYLVSGVADGQPNLEILKSIAETMKIIGKPFILGGIGK